MHADDDFVNDGSSLLVHSRNILRKKNEIWFLSIL